MEYRLSFVFCKITMEHLLIGYLSGAHLYETSEILYLCKFVFVFEPAALKVTSVQNGSAFLYESSEILQIKIAPN